MLDTLSTIAQTQSKPTKHAQNLCYDVSDYYTTYPNTGLRYYKSDMILQIDPDASYLIAPEAKSRVAG